MTNLQYIIYYIKNKKIQYQFKYLHRCHIWVKNIKASSISQNLPQFSFDLYSFSNRSFCTYQCVL